MTRRQRRRRQKRRRKQIDQLRRRRQKERVAEVIRRLNGEPEYPLKWFEWEGLTE